MSICFYFSKFNENFVKVEIQECYVCHTFPSLRNGLTSSSNQTWLNLDHNYSSG